MANRYCRQQQYKQSMDKTLKNPVSGQDGRIVLFVVLLLQDELCRDEFFGQYPKLFWNIS